jgi:hypothetical protein
VHLLARHDGAEDQNMRRDQRAIRAHLCLAGQLTDVGELGEGAQEHVHQAEHRIPALERGELHRADQPDVRGENLVESGQVAGLDRGPEPLDHVHRTSLLNNVSSHISG